MDDTLLDVFVNVQPAAGVIQATEDAIEEAAKRMRDKFVTVSNASLAAAQQAAAAARQVQNSFGGGGSGGSGGSGGGGGSGPGGRPQRSGVAAEFEQAKRQAEDLLEQTTRMRDVISTIRVSSLTGEYKTIESLTERIALNVSRQRKDNDLAGVRQSLTDLRELELRIRQLQTTSVVTADLRARFSAESNSGAQAIIDERLRSRLAQSQIRGLPSGELRTQILEASNLVQRLEADVKRLQQGFDGTQDSVDRLSVAIQRFQEGSEALGNLQSQAKAAGPSFNTLTNNAYQLGQAVEDFAVGFSLNGLAGGIRGAANNVAFLLNDMSEIPGVQEAIGENFARYLPVIAGIGSALAITVLPPLVEWLESLNDIEASFDDVAAKARQVQGDLDFTSGLARSVDEIKRFAREADSTREVLKRIQVLREEAISLQRDVLGGVRGDLTSGVSEQFEAGLRRLTSAISAELDIQEKSISERLSSLPDGDNLTKDAFLDVIRKFNKDSPSRALVDAKDAADKFLVTIKEIQADADKGIVNEEKVRSARDLMRQIKDSADGLAEGSSVLAKNLDLADGFGAKLQKNADAFLDSITKQAESAAKIKSLYEQEINAALTITKSKFDEVTLAQDILRGSIEGTIDTEALFVNETRKLAIDAARTLADVQKLFSEAGVDSALVDQVVKLQQAVDTTEIQNKFLERQKQIKDQIKDRDERIAGLSEKTLKNDQSRQTTLERLLTTIQESALSGGAKEEAARKKNEESIREEVVERQKLINSLQKLDEAYNASGDPAKMREILSRRADRFSVEPLGVDKRRDFARDWLEPIIQQIVAAQNRTTESVKQKDMSPRAQ